MLANMETRYGADGVAIFSAWQQLMNELEDKSELEKITQINNFFNQRIHYTEDRDLWQQSDYWATPMETMGMRAGDCEDYTIAKYVSLVQLGIPIQQLRLIYVKARMGGAQSKIYQAHMVLGYYSSTSAIPLILDSLVTGLESATNRPDLRPVFSFNSEGLWIGNQQALADPTARLSRWRNLLNRTRQEGFDLLSK